MVTREYHYMQAHILNTLFTPEPSILGIAYHVTYAAHLHAVPSRINYDSCVCH